MAIMNDGFSTTIAFASDSSILMEEKEIAPPGIDGGGAIDVTTMQNTKWRTMVPKSLKTLSEVSLVVAWDPQFFNEVDDMINLNQQITVTFPDGASLVFFGFINTFVPNAHVEGEQPTAEMTIIPTNQNTSGVEVNPNYIAA